jgi:hypothetical protein
MSFLDIKNLPISRCKGEIFEAALKQAIELDSLFLDLIHLQCNA